MAFTYGNTTYATLNGSSAKAYEVRVGYEPQEYSITNNTTPVNLIMQVRTISSSYGTWGFTQTSTLGEVKFGAKTFSVREKNKWVTFASTTITVTHNDDGTYSGTVSGSFTTNASDTYTLKSGSASVDMVLPTIPRATTPTISSTTITMGSSATITLTPASSTFKHKLKYSFGGVANLTSGLSIGSDFSVSGISTLTFTPPTSLGEYIPTSMSGQAIITCTTYDETNNQIGDPKEITITVNVPEYTPTVSIAIKGNNLLDGVYVQGKSTATYTITASGAYGSTIQAYSSTLDNVTYSGSSFTTGLLSNGTKVLVATVVDSRGKAVTINASSIYVEPYSIPSITLFTAERGSDETTVIAKVVGNIASCGGKNTSTITITLNNETKTVASGESVTFTGIDTDLTYTIVANIADAYTNVSKNISISTVAVTFDINKSGKGFAFGKVSEKDELEIAWNVDLHGKKIKNANILDLIYPIGSIYMSVNNVSPAVLFGGTWEQLKDQFLIGAGNKYDLGASGGEETSLLTIENLPSHNHSVNITSQSSGEHTHTLPKETWMNTSGVGMMPKSGSYYAADKGNSYSTSSNGEHTHSVTGNTENTGSGTAHNNMPPYLAVYMWKRVEDSDTPSTVTVTDDGYGNVTITGATVTDDGYGNLTIDGIIFV